MKIEYLPDGSVDCPLVRIYGDEPSAVRMLRDIAHDLSSGSLERVAVHEASGFVSLGGCELYFAVSTSDIGVVHRHGTNIFECTLTKSAWENVSDLISPLGVEGATGHQWLEETSNISLLLSRNKRGEW